MKNISIKLILLVWCLALQFPVFGFTQRNLLQKAGVSVDSLKKVLIVDYSWVPCPDYDDRDGWDNFLGDKKEYCIGQGEECLDYKWQIILATDYLEYQRSGSRDAMQTPYGENNDALSKLVIAELAEGKGRFIDQIINGVYQYCQMASWAVSAHLNMQKFDKVLPYYKENIIDLQVADVGAFLSWTYYFLHKEFDKVNPVISDYLRAEITRRVLDPYMANPSMIGWMALGRVPRMVNNWNTWCNSNVLQCFLLVEDDKDKLAAAVWQSMQSVDQFINFNHEDGACAEGPSYWGVAAGKMFDYLDLLSLATGGKISIFSEPIIKNLGEYISNTYAGNKWTVNFSDASAKSAEDFYLWYRFGKAVNSLEMVHLAALLYNPDIYPFKSNKRQCADIFKGLRAMNVCGELLVCKPEHRFKPYVAYPQSEMCLMSNNAGYFFAAKGGNNGESHNHNDVGSFVLYIDSKPVIIDAGVGTYTRQTFGPERYTIWTMRSDYHNLPIVNGIVQKDGKEYRAGKLIFNEKKKFFSVDIASAYPDEAQLKKWERSYRLEKDKLRIIDSFVLNEILLNNEVIFMLPTFPQIVSPGKIMFDNADGKVFLQYEARQFEPTVEIITLDDTKLSTVWGKTIYRVILKSIQPMLSGTYTYTISKK